MEFINLFVILVLSGFIGFYVVTNVTPSLHSPLIAITNVISSVVIVGSLSGLVLNGTSLWLSFFATLLASINIVGGFIISFKMLSMYKKNKT